MGRSLPSLVAIATVVGKIEWFFNLSRDIARPHD